MCHWCQRASKAIAILCAMCVFVCYGSLSAELYNIQRAEHAHTFFFAEVKGQIDVRTYVRLRAIRRQDLDVIFQ